MTGARIQIIHMLDLFSESQRENVLGKRTLVEHRTVRKAAANEKGQQTVPVLLGRRAAACKETGWILAEQQLQQVPAQPPPVPNYN